jgi:2-phospho-L-lactate/phosphoenolpyruvate guanylyltransferase
MTAALSLPWRLVVPVKASAVAKSRLRPPDGVRRADLAHALARDTLTAVFDCLPAAHVVVVTSDPGTRAFVRDRGGLVERDPAAGLNAAVAAGARVVQRHWGDSAVAVLLGDLPALRPSELASALSACAEHDRAFVPDAEGTGTVLLSAASPGLLLPLFGTGSAWTSTCPDCAPTSTTTGPSTSSRRSASGPRPPPSSPARR